MPDTIVKLGEFSFRAFEVPEHIVFGGQQSLAIHQLVGGARYIDAMGPIEMPLEWDGRFRGLDAQERGRYLQNMRKKGLPLLLTWAEFSYRVLIRDLSTDFQRIYEIPYRISCEVLKDETQPLTALSNPDIDSLVSGDMSTASGLVASINEHHIRIYWHHCGDWVDI